MKTSEKVTLKPTPWQLYLIISCYHGTFVARHRALPELSAMFTLKRDFVIFFYVWQVNTQLDTLSSKLNMAGREELFKMHGKTLMTTLEVSIPLFSSLKADFH